MDIFLRRVSWLLLGCVSACTLMRPLDELDADDPASPDSQLGGGATAASGATSATGVTGAAGAAGATGPSQDARTSRAGAPSLGEGPGGGVDFGAGEGGSGSDDAVGGKAGSGEAGEIAGGDAAGAAGAGETGAAGAAPDAGLAGSGDGGTEGATGTSNVADAGSTCTQDLECAEGRCVPGAGCVPCPPDMQLVRFRDGTAFCIDRREVTQAEYEEFIEKVDARPDISFMAACVLNASYVPDSAEECSGSFDPAVGAALPVTCVDACDAFAYCAWAGKRLCAGKNGERLEPLHRGDLDRDEWQVACSDSTSSLYPYGGNFDAEACNVGSNTLVAAGSLDKCRTPSGIFDLSGNVSEWTQSCDAANGCAVRGGSYLHQSASAVGCYSVPALDGDPEPLSFGSVTAPHIGIRCCAD